MAEPYLPPEVPDDNTPPTKPRRQAKKTLALWVLLIVMFAAFYQYSGTTPTRNAPPPCTDTSSIFTWLGPLLALGATAAFAFLWWQLRGGAQHARMRAEPAMAFADGQLERAASLYRAIAHDLRAKLNYESDARLTLAQVLLQQGKLADAEGELLRVEKRAGLVWADFSRLQVALWLPRVYALRGELDAAETWLVEARKRLARARYHRGFAAAVLRVSEAIVRARQCRFDEIAHALDEDRGRLEHWLSVQTTRDVWLMRAFATTPRDGVRGPGDTQRWLDLVCAQPRGCFDHLAVEWPELKAFLDVNGLSRPTA